MRIHRLIISFGFLLALAACASSGNNNRDSVGDFQQQMVADERVSEINEQLMMMAVDSSGGGVYRVGPEDRLRVEIMGAEDLSREYRVNGAGRLQLPLVGGVAVAGLSLDEVEQAIAEAYGESYLRNPQVSVEVTEFRSQQFTVVGAVTNPRVYNTTRQITLIEALAMAGGINREAGSNVYLTDRVIDPETAQPVTRTLIIDVEDLMRNAQQYNLVLGEAAMINVPRGGFVYVEGQVERPGAYPQRADTTILKALAEAGGLTFEASRSNIRVLRRDSGNGAWESMDVTYRQIRENPDSDINLRSGDIVIVEASGARSAWTQFWRVASPIALLGFRPL
jgi:polysaccharide biosynthesis/export protein